GEFKDLGSGSRAMTLAEKELLAGMISDVYEQFLDAVVAGRSTRIKTMIVPTAPETVQDETVREQVRQYADGRVFSGRQAVEYGMIDGIKTLDEVIYHAAQKAGLDVDNPAVVRAPIKAQGLFGSLDNIATKIDKNDFGIKEGVKFEYRFGAD
ncbi:MAG: S49 family peptidase, partial [Candidatus Sumerlaeota bacterium]